MKISDLLGQTKNGVSDFDKAVEILNKRTLDLVESPEKVMSNRIVVAVTREIAWLAGQIVDKGVQPKTGVSDTENHFAAFRIATYLNGLQGVAKNSVKSNETIKSLQLSRRVEILLGGGHEKLRTLLTQSTDNIMEIKGIGVSRLWKIRRALAERGYYLIGDEKWFNEHKPK